MAKVKKLTADDIKEVYLSKKAEIETILDKNADKPFVLLEHTQRPNPTGGFISESLILCPYCGKTFVSDSTFSYYGRKPTCSHCKKVCNNSTKFNKNLVDNDYKYKVRGNGLNVAIETDELVCIANVYPNFIYQIDEDKVELLDIDLEFKSLAAYSKTTKKKTSYKNRSLYGSASSDVTTFSCSRLSWKELFPKRSSEIFIGFDEDFNESAWEELRDDIDKISKPKEKTTAEIVFPAELYEPPIQSSIEDFIKIASTIKESDLLNNIDIFQCKCLICGQTFLFEKERYSHLPFACPYCGETQPNYLPSRYSPHRTAYIKSDEDKATVSIVSEFIENEDTLEPTVNSTLDGFYVLSAKKSQGFVKDYKGNWVPVRYDNKREAVTVKKVVTLSTTGLLKYSAMEEFESYMNESDQFFSRDIMTYIVNTLKYPVVEKVAKLGLLEEYTKRECTYNPTNFSINAETVHDAFFISKPLLKYYRNRSDISNMTMQDLQHWYAYDKTVKGEEVDWACREHVNPEYFKQVRDIIPDMTTSKICAYMERVRIAQMFAPQMAISEWRDYLKACKSIGMDMHDNKVLYPHALKTEHDVVVAKQRLILNEEVRQSFMESVEKYKDLEYHRDDWFIKVPTTMEEMFEEGRKLKHCCGQYVDDVSKGTAFVLFLRRKDAPEEPFLSIEVSPDLKVKQVRGINDTYIHIRDDFREISDFLFHWSKMKHLVLDMK